MKTKKEIEREIKKLRLIAENTGGVRATAAYEAWHALRWVIEKVDWKVSKLVEKYDSV